MSILDHFRHNKQQEEVGSLKTEKRLLTTAELGRLLGLSRMIIYRYCREGMPHIRLSRKVIRYDPVDIMGWLQKKKE